MFEWLEGLAGPQFATAFIWTLAALILLAVVLFIVRTIRSMTFGTFVAGGRNRKTRLAVMDATAVDSHRRLVLVRRDDVEHLILIGGPTDVVVEREIRLGGQPRRPALTADNGHEAPTPPPAPARPRQPEAPQPRAAAQPQQQQRAPVQPQRQVERQVERPQPARPQAQPRPTAPQPQRAQAPQPAPAPASYATTAATYAPPPVSSYAPPAPLPYAPPPAASPYSARPTASATPPRNGSLDDTLLNELELNLDSSRKPAKPGEISLDDEMNRLLGELSSQKS